MNAVGHRSRSVREPQGAGGPDRPDGGSSSSPRARRSTDRPGAPRAARRARGFSLIELIVVLEIALFTALISVPKVSAFFAEYQLMSATNQVGFEIIRARTQAVGQNRFVRIRMVSGTEYLREKSVDGATWAIDGVLLNLPRGVTATTTSAQVQFDRRGYATVNNSVVLRTGLGQVKTVATNAIGRVTIT